MSKAQLHHFDSTNLEYGRVDPLEAKIFGVSLITSGVTARGHDLIVDEKTLSGMYECAAKMGKVPTKLDHRTGISQTIGYLTNFHLKDNKLKADWHLLKTHPQCSLMLEMADTMGGSFGLSAAFMGKSETVSGKQYARCTELISADCVVTPAANPDGLFESIVDTGNKKITHKEFMANDTEKTTDQKYDELLAMFAASQAQLSEFGDVLNNLVQFAMDDSNESESDEDEDEEDEHEHKGKKHEYSSAEDALVYLEAKMQKQLEAEQDKQLTHAFDVIQDKVIALSQINEELKAENDALRLNFEKGNGTSAGASRASDVKLFSAATDKDTWEERVTELTAEYVGKGMTELSARPKAISTAIEENPSSFRAHQERVGLIRA